MPGRLATPDISEPSPSVNAPFGIDVAPSGGGGPALPSAPEGDADGDSSSVVMGLVRGLLRGKRALARGSSGAAKRAVVRGLPSPVVTTIGKTAATQATKTVAKQVTKSVAKQATKTAAKQVTKGVHRVRAAARGLPHPVVSRVGQGASKLGDAVGVIEAVADTAHQRQETESLTSRAWMTVKQAAPHFIREAVLGTALFAVYEELSTFLGNKLAIALDRPDGLEQVSDCCSRCCTTEHFCLAMNE
jgi:hypothetical protein